MAKRRKTRINKTFLVVIAAAGVTVMGGGFALLKLNRAKHPERYIAAGDDAVKHHDFIAARDDYAVAAGMLPRNAELHLKLGKVFYQLRSLSDENMHNCIMELTQAEELNPDLKEAWGALLTAIQNDISRIEAAPGNVRDREALPGVVSLARDACDHLVKIDPTNLEARIAISTLKIRVWLLKLPIPSTPAELLLPPDKQKTDDQKIDDTIADLTKLMSEHPEDEHIPYWIARAKINEASNLLDLVPNNPDAVPLFAEAAGEFDNSIAVQPKNVNLYLRKADILSQLQRTDPFAATAPAYQRQLRQALDSAQGLADPNNPEEYQAAKFEWAQYLRQADPARSEEVFNDLITRFSSVPQFQLNALQYRLELADLLRQDVSRQKDALALLDAIPSIPPSTLVNYEQQQGWARGVSVAKLRRGQIEIDQLTRQPIGKQRDDLIADITASLDAAEAHLAGTIPLLQARTKFSLATNHLRDAIQTVTLAAEKSTQQTGSVPYDLLRLEAECYMRGSQTGRAIEILETEIKKNPQIANSGEIQGLLANLYLQNKDLQGAKPHIEWLSARSPNEPAVIALEIQELGPDPDPKLAKALFDKLPEQTPPQVAVKLNVAEGLLKNAAEVARLAKIQHAADPGALEPVRHLIVYDMGRADKLAAQTVLDEFSKASPDNPNIHLFADVINGDTPQMLWQAQLDSANGLKDPLQRELALANVYAAGGLINAEAQHLQAARVLIPNDAAVLQRIFFIYVELQRYSEAEAMLPQLSALDVDSAHGLMLKAKLALARKDTSTALIVGRQLIKDVPEFSGSWEIYGEALEASGEAEAACQQFNSALEKQAANVDARRGVIACSVQQGKFDDARRYIKEARERFPDDNVYKEMEVGFEIHYGNPESIVSTVMQNLEDHPESRKNYSIASEALLASSVQASGRGDSDGANRYMDRAKAVDQQAVAHWPDDLQLTIGLAEVCLQKKEISGAEDALKAIVARPRWKNQPAPLSVLAEIEMKDQKFDVAEGMLKQALADDEHYVQARTELADCLVAEKQYDPALAILKPACSEFAVLDKYVKLLLQLSRGSEAEDMVVAARKTDINNLGLTNLLIDTYQSEHKASEALALANSAISSDPSNTGAYLRRGELEASGVNADFEAARKDLRLYSDAVPTDVGAHVMLAEVLDHSQDRDAAIQELKAAIKYGPLERQPRLMLLSEYLFATPSRTADAEQLLTATLAIPEFQNDSLFEMQEAKLYAEKGDNDRALAAAHDAISHAPDKSSMIDDYLSILLLAKKYDRLLDESKDYAADPKATWQVFVFRGSAKAQSGDKAGATEEFQTALNRAGAEKSTRSARDVALSIVAQLGSTGTATALDLIAPRAKNSAAWSLVAIDLYQKAAKPGLALAAAESAMNSFDTFTQDDQDFLLDRVSSLYIRCNPPKTSEAMAAYQKQYARNPNNINAMNNIASVLVDMTVPPQPKEALVWSRKAYDLCKQNNLIIPAIYDTHGWVLIQCGQLDDGIEVLHSAVDKSDFPDAHYHLAMGYLFEKHPEDAKRELALALGLMVNAGDKIVLLDPELKAKIDRASKQADQMIEAMAPAGPATSAAAP